MKNNLIFGIVGLIIGIAATSLVSAHKPQQHTNMQSAEPMNMEKDTSMTMDSMTKSLMGKTGDDFDKTFLTEMIEHHKGAVDMANLAEKNAKHEEIKQLSQDIITAQEKEIEQMKEWKKNWGY